MDRPSQLSGAERLARLTQLVKQRGRVSVSEICDEFGVSAATARRDLDALALGGRVLRVHGGAIVSHSAPAEGPVLQRASDQAAEKERIGLVAAQLVEPGDSIFIGSGTTTLQLARNLPEVRGLTVVTNSLLALNVLSERQALTLICLGGILRRTEGSLIGHIAEQSLKELRVHKVFLGMHAVDVEAGLTNDFLQETMIDRQILDACRKVVLLADHTKCGRVSTAFVAPLSRVHTLITDNQTSADFVERVRDLGVTVLAV